MIVRDCPHCGEELEFSEFDEDFECPECGEFLAVIVDYVVYMGYETTEIYLEKIT